MFSDGNISSYERGDKHVTSGFFLFSQSTVYTLPIGCLKKGSLSIWDSAKPFYVSVCMFRDHSEPTPGGSNHIICFFRYFLFPSAFCWWLPCSHIHALFSLNQCVYLTVFFASEIVRNTQLYSLLPVIAITSCLIISVLAPVRNKNHPLSAGAYNRNRKIALCIVLIETSILIVLWFWKSIRPFLIVPTMSLAAVAVMMIITLFRKEENEL